MSFTLDRDSYKNYDCDEDDTESSSADEDDDDDEHCDNAGFNRYSDLYQSSLTKVSQFLTFDLILETDLETNIQFTFSE